MLISLLKGSKLPKEFLDCIPDNCEYCGEELEISESLMSLECTNRECSGKVISKLYKLLKQIGVDYMSKSDCKTFVEKYDLKNHLAIFDYLPEVDGELFDGFGDKKSDKLYEDLEEYKSNVMLYEYVSLAYMPNLEGYEEYVFKGYNNLDKFYDELYSKQVSFIDDLLNSLVIGEKHEGLSIKAYNIYRELIDYESFLKEHISTFTFCGNKVMLSLGVVGDLDSECVSKIKDRFNNNLLGVTFSKTLDTNTLAVLDLIGVKDENGIVYNAYKDTSMYREIDMLDLDILSYDECVGTIEKGIKQMGV